MKDPVPDPAIAIVGMAAHLPGAADVEQYWANLRGGVESVTRLTDEALRAAGVPEALIADPRYVKAGAILEGMDGFDAGFFGLSPRDAAIMDPQTRHFLECAWHALEHAGHVPEGFDGPIGVFAGAGAAQYFWRNVVADAELLASVGYFLLRHTGNDKDFLATRASYELNLTGPSVGVQTACSTSLVAAHYACQSLLSWECDLALAGGVTIEQPHGTGYRYVPGEILSPDGHCRPFDHRAEGTIFGSGAGVVVLRRLEDALRDGDTIHAVILGSAVNNDGAGKVSYLAPSVDGHAQAVAEALSAAGVSAESIGFVEAHGTGTPVGDPIEVAALTQAFRADGAGQGGCALGSVKSNIGHLDTAAGVASLIKATLAVRDGQIPPTLHFERPNPLLDLETSPFYVNAQLVPWPERDTPRRAGVSSLGVGGTNAHVVLQQPPLPPPSAPARPWQLLTLSARSPTALQDASRQLVEHLEAHPQASLPDVAHTLSRGRRRFSHRRALVCRSAEQAVEALTGAGSIPQADAVSEAAGRPVAFLFAGGGVQYPNMGRGLYDHEPVFRQVADECLGYARADADIDFDLGGLLHGDAGEQTAGATALRRPSRALPALFTVQYAQAKLWMSWGIQPATLLGHSMGEYTAACLAGVMAPGDALSLVALRGRLFETLPRGAMLSVSLDEPALRARLPAELSIAALNGPEISVAAGPAEAIETLHAALTQDGVPCRRIHIDVAAHSAMLEPILAVFGERVARLSLSPPTLPLISNLSGALAGDEVSRPDYWVRHLRETVRFADGVGKLVGPDGPILLEVGPGRALRTLARMHPGWTAAQLVTSSMPAADEALDAQAAQLAALGELWAHGAEPDWSAFHGPGRRRVPLPGYPFERRPYFIAPPAAQARPAPGAPTPTAAGRTPRNHDPTDWTQQRQWSPTPLPSAHAGPLPGVATALVLADPGGLGEALAARLESCGVVVVRVHAGSGPASSAGPRQVRPDSAEDWRALIDELQAAATLPDLVVHAWCLDRGEGPRAEEDRAVYAPLHLLQALEALAPGHPLRLVALTSGALESGDDAALRPDRALLLGPVRVAPAEISSLSATLIEVGPLPPSAGQPRLLDRLLAELASPPASPVVVYRGGERLAEGFAPVPLGPQPLDSALPEGAVVLITGGLGGLGLAIARDLAQTCHARLALLGRQAAPLDPALRAELGDPLVLQGDVTDPGRMVEVIAQVRQSLGRLDGVIHAAGRLDDGPLLARSPEQVRAVLAPKVAGTKALWAALQPEPPDFLLLFSSVSAVVGAPGQLDYAAANSFLDAFARARAADSPTRVVSLAWGAWKEVGMAARLAGAQVGPEAAAAIARGPRPTLFDTFEPAGEGGALLHGTLYKDRHWMLGEHRLRGGDWVLPGSGYVELLRQAHAQARPGQAFALRDLVFLRSLRLGPAEVRQLALHLEPDGGALRATVRSRSPGAERWEEHATACLLGAAPEPPPPEALAAVTARLGTPTPSPQPPHPVMDFGPRWGNVVAVARQGDEVLLRQALAPEFQEDVEALGLHPALLDMATAGALMLAPEPAADSLFVPAGYGALTLRQPLPAELSSHIRLRESDEARGLVSFDVTLFGGGGEVVATVDDFSMVRVPRAALAPSAAPDWLRDAIAPADGIEVLRRVLTHPTGPHVLVATRPLDALQAEARERPAPRPPKPARSAPTRVLRADVADALRAHEAVAEAAALGEAPGSEAARLVAFVVYEPTARTTASQLRRFVRERLGQAFVPQHFVEMVALPRGPDGGVLAAELRDPLAAAAEVVGPRTPTERTIAAIWAELLGLDEVGVHDNFLDVGGHSLVGIRVLVRIHQQTGVRLEANALTMQTLEQLAAEVDRTAAPAPVATTAPAPTAAPPPQRPAPPAPAEPRPGLLSRLRNTLSRP